MGRPRKEKPNSICYVSYINLKSSKASTSQVFNTLYALGKKYEIVFLTHFITKRKLLERVKNYGIKMNFRVARVPSFPAESFWFQQINRFLYSISVLLYLLYKGSRTFDYIYTRDFAFIYFLSFIPSFLRPKVKIIFESHKIFHKVSDVVSLSQEKKAYDIVDFFVATSEQCKKDLVHDFGIQESNVLVAPNGVNLNHFQKYSPKKKVLAKYKISNNEKVLVYSGSFFWWKGVDDLIRAMKYVKTKDVKLLLIGGNDEDFNEMVELVKKEGLEEKVVFTGYLPQFEMMDLLYSSNIAIMPNNFSVEGENYTSPMKLFEYMSCGLPMIASDLKAMKIVLKDKRNSLFFLPEDERDLARKIDSLLNDKVLMSSMSKNNREDVQKYTWDRRIEKIQVYLEKKWNKDKYIRKIGFVIRGLTQGGVKRFIVNILNEIENVNHSDFEFHVVHDEPEFEGKFRNIQTHYVKINNKILFDYLVSFNLLRKLKFEVLVYPKNVIPVPHFLLRGKKINIIHDLGYFESSIEAYPFWDTLFMKAFMKMSCRFSDKTFAVSNATKKDIIKRFGVEGHKIVVINEGVEDNFKIIKDKKRLNYTLKKYELNEKFLFYAGSVSPRKNLMRVLEAFNKIKEEIPHSLVITGNKAWGKDKLEDYVKENLQGRVKRLGFVSEDELVDLYNLADGYVFPSLYEGFGLPILEAQKCACPVLTSNVTSCPEVAGDSTIIVDPYSVDDIADGILKLTTDKVERKKLVKKGFENIKRYSWAKTGKTILNFLNSVKSR